MPEQTAFELARHGMLLGIAGAICLFGSWVGMRHFARVRATSGPARLGWLLLAAIGTGTALWASTYLSILALEPRLDSGFERVPLATTLAMTIFACLFGLEIASRLKLPLASELGGMVLGGGVITTHFVALSSWHVAGTIFCPISAVIITLALGFGLGALAINRANHPLTRWCRHGTALLLTLMIMAIHGTLSVSLSVVPDPSQALAPEWLPGLTLGAGAIGAALLVIGSGLASYVIDLRVRTEAAERIHQLSFNDTMTGLPNRIAFNERLAIEIAEAHDNAEKVAAFSIDVDAFKDVNDLLGHDGGDLLLIELAHRMREAIGPEGYLARHSGDEFLAVQTSGHHPDAARAFAGRLAQAFAKPFAFRGQTVMLTASIGCSIFPIDSRDRDQLLRNAKLAMHRGKNRQSGLITLYSREMDDSGRARRALARDLQSALERDELSLHYQLQASLQDGGICGTEALMRWHHPKRGMIPPAEFIPMAEETEVIVAIGEWALRTACRDATAGKIPGTVAVNLSPVQFGRDDLAATIRGILVETGLSPRRLEVEVTESTIMSDPARGLHVLRQLKTMGISVAMDDFGTGYSSLSTLHAFPFDKIKLDQSFVKRLPSDVAAAAIVRTVIALGASLGMPVLAEGIETDAQWQLLAREGCAQGQGYLFARPVPLAKLAEAIRAARRFVRDEAPASSAALHAASA